MGFSKLVSEINYTMSNTLSFYKNQKIYKYGKIILTMEDINITKISSKGQVVIPQEMRKHLEEGDKLVVMKNKDQIILKKVKDFSKNIEEDLEFAKKTEEAWKSYERGEFKEMDFDDFIEEMKKW